MLKQGKKGPKWSKMAQMSQKAQSGPKQSRLLDAAQNDPKFWPPNIYPQKIYEQYFWGHPVFKHICCFIQLGIPICLRLKT